MGSIKWPFGPSETIAIGATGAQAVTIKNSLTVVDGVSTVATGNRTINLTIDDEVKAGAMLFVKSKTTATETTVFGTGMSGATITGVAGKTKTTLFIYDGSTFVNAGAPVQID
jgi:hypothetical protein